VSNYIQKIRQKIGHEKFIHPAARILVENDKGEFLFIERADNEALGIPAGALEEKETIEECIVREVKEETGLELLAVELIGISSSPEKETVKYPNGDKIQYFTIEFYSNEFKGTIKVTDVAEVKTAAFKNKSYLKKLPSNESGIVESLSYFREMNKVKLS